MIFGRAPVYTAGVSSTDDGSGDSDYPPPPPSGSPSSSSSFPPPPDEVDGDRARRRRLESILREAIRRGVALRDLVGDVKLPREMASYVFSQVDETKNALVRGVAREVRDFLNATDVAAEFRKALTSLSFEIRTEVRFIPNEAGDGVRPQVRARATPRRRKSTRPVPVADSDSDPSSPSDAPPVDEP